MYRMFVASRVRATWRAINSGKQEAAFGLASPDMSFTFVGDTPFGARFTGRDRFKDWFQSFAEKFPGLQFTVEDVAVTGWPWNTRAAVRLGVRGTLADGTPYRNHAVQWLRLRWGRMVDDWVLEDTLTLNEACRRQGITAATS